MINEEPRAMQRRMRAFRLSQQQSPPSYAMASTVYIADPDPTERSWIEAALAPSEGPFRTFDSASDLLGLVQGHDDACLIVAVEPDESAAVALVQELRALGIAVPVIAIGPGSAFRTAVELARLPHTEYVERPVSAGRLRAAVRRARSWNAE